MAKQVILGSDLGRDALKVKCNVNFTELYEKDVELEQKIGTDISTHDTDETAHDDIRTQINSLDADVIAHKAEKATQNGYGHIRLSDIPESGGKRTARFVIGTSTSGWTEKDCDYLCDGVDDQVEINQAIQDLPASGGEIIILDGVYNIENLIHIQKPNTKIKGNGKSTVLKRMFSNTINSGYIILRADYIIIEDITLDGNRNIFESFRNRIISTHPTIEPMKTNYSVIKNCFLKDGSGDYAISLDGNYNYVIKNLITNCKGQGVLIYNNENTISQNMIYDCDYGIFVRGSNNLITSNNCKRGEGLPADYTTSQYTIRLNATSSSNLVTSNLCLGKAIADGGTGNTLANNKWE